MKAIIVKGNPKFIQDKRAKDYYQEIKAFLVKHGVSKVGFDPGEDFTCPDKTADIYIGHSRGAGRIRCMKTGEEWRFLQFGDPDGIMHPKDREWHDNPVGNPPNEHFHFIEEQKEAIVKLINKLNKKGDTEVSNESLTSLLGITNVRTANFDKWKKSKDGVLWVVGYLGSNYQDLGQQIGGGQVKTINFDMEDFHKAINGEEVDIAKVSVAAENKKKEIIADKKKKIVMGAFLSLTEFSDEDSIVLLQTGMFSSSNKNANQIVKDIKETPEVEDGDVSKAALFIISLVANGLIRDHIKKMYSITKPDVRFNKFLQRFYETKPSIESQIKFPPSTHW